GSVLSISGESENAVMNKHSTPMVTLAVGAPKDYKVRVYKCKTLGCEKIGDSIYFSGSFVSLSRGEILHFFIPSN
ncbi:MAG: hypothetical protein DWH70_10945, partial [Planctomycetota bacterium]